MINQQTAQSVVNYLVSAGALTATQGQGIVWQDFLNSDEGGVKWATGEDCRHAVRELLAQRAGQVGRVTPGDLAKVLRRIAARRIREAGEPEEIPTDPAAYLVWLKARNRALVAGASVDDAEREAWQRIGAEAPARVGRSGASRKRIENILVNLATVKKLN